MTTSDSLRVVLSGILRVLLHCLNCNQSVIVLQNMFATQRSIVYKVSIMFLFWKMQILSNRRLDEPFRSTRISRHFLVRTPSKKCECSRRRDWMNRIVLIYRCFPGYTREDSSILEPVIEWSFSYRFYPLSFTETSLVFSSVHFLAFFMQLF